MAARYGMRLPQDIYTLVTRTETIDTPHAQELEDVVSVIKLHVSLRRRRAYGEYFARGEEARAEIRRRLGMRRDTMEEWLRASTRALLTYWLESDDLEHTDAAEDIWYDRGKREKKNRPLTSPFRIFP